MICQQKNVKNNRLIPNLKAQSAEVFLISTAVFLTAYNLLNWF
jgi:hypothetical protein